MYLYFESSYFFCLFLSPLLIFSLCFFSSLFFGDPKIPPRSCVALLRMSHLQPSFSLDLIPFPSLGFYCTSVAMLFQTVRPPTVTRWVAVFAVWGSLGLHRTQVIFHALGWPQCSLNSNDLCPHWMTKEVIEFRNVPEVGGGGAGWTFQLGRTNHKTK